MSITRSLEISASGLTAERLRMDVISNNLANVNTTKTAEGGPYRRQHVVFEAAQGADRSGFASVLQSTAGMVGLDGTVGAGVRVAGVESDQGPLKRVPDPDHPGQYIDMPNVEPVMEMVDLISATRAYEAGVTAIGAAKQMQQKALEIGK